MLSPVEKRRLLVEDSGEVKIAVAERKVFSPGDLLVTNGFKESDYYTDQPCQVPNCKDPACVFGHTCKCKLHKEKGAVLVGECFSVFKKSGYRTITCLSSQPLTESYNRRRLKCQR